MSATSYAPACSSAKSTGETPLALGVKLGFIKDNRFLFDYEHSKIIYDRCLDHISACQLPARCLRVINTILRQTVGFGKLEDHATTTRLEQLTKIRHDHIGNTLRYLSKRNIIKWRKGGKYNNYLSINYDFASWGERNPQKQHPNNDPTILLPNYYTKTPVDQGFCFDDPEDKALFDNDLDPAENAYLEPETRQSHSDINAAQELNTDKYLDKDSVIQVVSEIVDKQFTQIKQLFKQNQAESHPIESSSTDKVKQNKESIDPVEQYEYKIRAYQKEIEALKQQSKQEITQLKQQSEQEITEVKQHSEQVELENSRLHKKQIETHIQNQTPNTINDYYLSQETATAQSLEEIDYPVQLSENDCFSAKKVVMKSPEKAQDILDLLAIRLNQTQPVLNNPIAYLARLVQKEQQNELDFSALQSFVRPQVIQRDLQALIIIHNRDYGQYIAYRDAVKSYDFQPDDPDNFAELKGMEDIYSESFDIAQDSYNVLKQYIAEFQLDENVFTQLDSYGTKI